MKRKRQSKSRTTSTSDQSHAYTSISPERELRHTDKDKASTAGSQQGKNSRYNPSEPLHITTRAASRAATSTAGSVASIDSRRNSLSDQQAAEVLSQQGAADNDADADDARAASGLDQRPAKRPRRLERSLTPTNRSTALSIKGASPARTSTNRSEHSPQRLILHVGQDLTSTRRSSLRKKSTVSIVSAASPPHVPHTAAAIGDDAPEDLTDSPVKGRAPNTASRGRGKGRWPRIASIRKDLMSQTNTPRSGTPTLDIDHEDGILSQAEHASTKANVRKAGRRRAQHKDVNIEAGLRRQLQLKTAYRTVARALKPVLAELAQREIEQVEAEIFYHKSTPLYTEMMIDLEKRLAQRTLVLDRKLALDVANTQGHLDDGQLYHEQQYEDAIAMIDDGFISEARGTALQLQLSQSLQIKSDDSKIDLQRSQLVGPLFGALASSNPRGVLGKEFESRSRRDVTIDREWVRCRTTDDDGKYLQIPTPNHSEEDKARQYQFHSTDLETPEGCARNRVASALQTMYLFEAVEAATAEDKRPEDSAETFSATSTALPITDALDVLARLAEAQVPINAKLGSHDHKQPLTPPEQDFPPYQDYLGPSGHATPGAHHSGSNGNHSKDNSVDNKGVHGNVRVKRSSSGSDGTKPKRRRAPTIRKSPLKTMNGSEPLHASMVSHETKNGFSENHPQHSHTSPLASINPEHLGSATNVKKRRRVKSAVKKIKRESEPSNHTTPVDQSTSSTSEPQLTIGNPNMQAVDGNPATGHGNGERQWSTSTGQYQATAPQNHMQHARNPSYSGSARLSPGPQHQYQPRHGDPMQYDIPRHDSNNAPGAPTRRSSRDLHEQSHSGRSRTSSTASVMLPGPPYADSRSGPHYLHERDQRQVAPRGYGMDEEVRRGSVMDRHPANFRPEHQPLAQPIQHPIVSSSNDRDSKRRESWFYEDRQRDIKPTTATRQDQFFTWRPIRTTDSRPERDQRQHAQVPNETGHIQRLPFPPQNHHDEPRRSSNTHENPHGRHRSTSSTHMQSSLPSPQQRPPQTFAEAHPGMATEQAVQYSATPHQAPNHYPGPPPKSRGNSQSSPYPSLQTPSSISQMGPPSQPYNAQQHSLPPPTYHTPGPWMPPPPPSSKPSSGPSKPVYGSPYSSLPPLNSASAPQPPSAYYSTGPPAYYGAPPPNYQGQAPQPPPPHQPGSSSRDSGPATSPMYRPAPPSINTQLPPPPSQFYSATNTSSSSRYDQQQQGPSQSPTAYTGGYHGGRAIQPAPTSASSQQSHATATSPNSGHAHNQIIPPDPGPPYHRRPSLPPPPKMFDTTFDPLAGSRPQYSAAALASLNAKGRGGPRHKGIKGENSWIHVSGTGAQRAMRGGSSGSKGGEPVGGKSGGESASDDTGAAGEGEGDGEP